MFDFRIFETQDYLDHLESILGKNQETFKRKLHEYIYPQLSRQPYFGKNIKKLKGVLHSFWRYRSGDIRLFYQIDSCGNVVLMTAAMFRKDAYRSS